MSHRVHQCGYALWAGPIRVIWSLPPFVAPTSLPLGSPVCRIIRFLDTFFVLGTPPYHVLLSFVTLIIILIIISLSGDERANGNV
jgi:hypothetical protein